MSYCNGCGKWAGAFAAPAGANTDHLCKCLTAGQKTMLAAIPPLTGAQPAPAAQPADSAMEALRELVESWDAVDASQLNFHGGDDEAVQERHRTAWDRARALVAKETPHAR